MFDPPYRIKLIRFIKNKLKYQDNRSYINVVKFICEIYNSMTDEQQNSGRKLFLNYYIG